jgi:hypothetical protein
MSVRIDGQKYRLLVDLGAANPFEIRTRNLDYIIKKSPSKSCTYISADDTLKQAAGFRIERMQIGKNLSINDAPIFEQADDCLKNQSLLPILSYWDHFKEWLDSYFIHGSVGWGFFRNTASFFDLKKSKIILAKDFKTLMCEIRHPTRDFVPIPFTVQPWGIVLEFGNKQFILDTGATVSILRPNQSEEGEIFLKNFKTESLIRSDCNLGSWNFCVYNFSHHFEVDGILGIDFFMKHAIAFDFDNQIAYIDSSSNIK